ncbi:MAG: DUF5119 domain-containing protein [Clostridium sp.]|nr:DUF5119 domain-containing protein [Clostridium sp.]
MRRLIMKWMLLLVSIMLVQACNTEVELCHSDHPHRATLDVHFDWGQWKDAGKHPDRMYVLAHRIVNSYKYIFSTEAKASGNRGSMLFPLEEQVLLYPASPTTPEPDVTPGETPDGDEGEDENEGGDPLPDGAEDEKGSDTDGEAAFAALADEDQPVEVWHKMRLKNGEYRFLAFNSDAEGFEMDGLDEFRTDPSYDMDNLHLRYKTHDLDEVLFEGWRSWKDYNPYARFVKNCNYPIFYATCENVPVTLNQKCTITFKPQPVTQKITVQFSINKERGVKIERMLADMSGIPSGIQFTTGYLDVEHTNKILFEPVFAAENINATTVNCTGELDVTSIMHSFDRNLVTGPGIMQLVVYTSTTDDDGQLRYKAIQCLINLRNTLREAALIKWADDDEHYVINKRSATLKINRVLTIQKGVIIEDSDNDTGMDRWIPAETIIIDA